MTSTRAEIRAALHELQDGRCALCGGTDRLCVDHDHVTGLVRGLLCRGCNIREGWAWPGKYPEVDAYRADPPAAGRDWLWQLPDTWTFEDSRAMRLAGMNVLEYLPQHLEAVAAREAALEQATIETARQRTW